MKRWLAHSWRRVWWQPTPGWLLAMLLVGGVGPAIAQTGPGGTGGTGGPGTLPDDPAPILPANIPNIVIDAPGPSSLPTVLPLANDRVDQAFLVGYPAIADPAREPLAVLRFLLPEPPLLLFPPDHGIQGSEVLPPNFPTAIFVNNPLLTLDPSLVATLPELPSLPPGNKPVYYILKPGQQAEVSPVAVTPDTPNVVIEGAHATLGLGAAMSDCYDATQDQSAEAENSSVADQLVACYTQNLAVAEAAANAPWTSYALNNLAVAYFIRGDYQTALSYHEQMLTRAQAQDNPVEVGIALAGIGAAYAALGQHDAAIAYYQQALGQLTTVNAPQWRSLTLRNLGNAVLAQNQTQAAIAYQQESLAIASTIGDRYGEAQAKGNLGIAYALASRFDEAIELHQQSLAIARQLQEPLLEAQALLGLGTAYSYRQKYEQAAITFDQAVPLMQRLEARLGEGIALTNWGDVLLRQKRLGEAQGKLYAAIAIWESLRAGLGNNDTFKVSIFETQAATYNNLQEVLVAQGKFETALEVAERGRARAFVELVARRTDEQTAMPAPPNIAAIAQLARQHNLTLVEYSIIRDQFVATPHGASLQLTSEPQETALYIWVVQPSGDVAFQQVPWPTQAPSLQQRVQQGRQALGVRGRGITIVSSAPEVRTLPTTFPELQQLHQLLIEPIAPWLPADPTATVVFLPQEELFLVPFAALQDSQGDYFLAQHTPILAPSIQVLGLTLARSHSRGAAPKPTDWLIVGNPTMPTLPDAANGPLPPLPGSATEATAIASLVGTTPLLGAMATEAQVTQQLQTSRYIHLATHGLLEDIEGQGVPGAIALTPDATHDGFLTATELAHLQLQADLVVLSACDTGGGRITGDGVIGLSRSLLTAGARSVVVSLWSVPDLPTADLMTAFYSDFGTLDKAQALRQAMLATQKDYPHPSAWAGFTLMGDWR